MLETRPGQAVVSGAAGPGNTDQLTPTQRVSSRHRRDRLGCCPLPLALAPVVTVTMRGAARPIKFILTAATGIGKDWDRTGEDDLITGGSAGIGLWCASVLADQGHQLILVGRNPDKLAAARTQVQANATVEVETLTCDFMSLAAVRALADDVLARHDRLDVLINNAGTVLSRRTETIDGHEATFAVNHLAGYLLTERLKPLLIASAPSRIVMTASIGHYQGTMDFDDLGPARDTAS
jgi:hypothetical protein